MIVKHSYQINLTQPSCHAPIQTNQGDTDTHAVVLTLYQDGTVWNVPEGAAAMVGYIRSDGVGGSYDTLSDGSAACTVSNNTVTAVLAAPMLAVSGLVRMTVYLRHEGQRLLIFDTVVQVRRHPAADTDQL